ncbi:hypothetical protein KFU94_45790 [Chloroflexi bacterium TSY]|nr:hypothetical protein [Chloroflexi bacterium TSY]
MHPERLALRTVPILLLFALALLPLPLGAQAPNDLLLTVGLADGAITSIGETERTDEVEAIAFIPNPDPNLTVLYGINANEFGRLNLATGEFTRISSRIGSGDGAAGQREMSDVDGLAFDARTNTMYGVHRRTGRDPDLLFKIDWATGKLIENGYSSGVDYVEIQVVSGLHDVDDIAVEPDTGQMYGVTNDDGRSGILLRIDKVTGSIQQIVGRIFDQNGGDTIDDIEGLAFDSNGNLFGSTGNNGPDKRDRNKLFFIDKNSGSAQERGQFARDVKDIEVLGCLTTPADPEIDVQKLTNGVDADDVNDPTIPSIKPGDPVTWQYIVTNVGQVPLQEVTLVDDKLAAATPPSSPTFVGGDVNGNGFLDLTETWIYEANAVAQDQKNSNIRGICGERPNTPLYQNTATVSGKTQSGKFVEDQDKSHYCNPSNPAIDIEKATNGPGQTPQDADSPNDPDVPEISPDDEVTWTYVVTNIGDVPLQNIRVVDDKLSALNPSVTPTLVSGDTNNDQTLDLDET